MCLILSWKMKIKIAVFTLLVLAVIINGKHSDETSEEKYNYKDFLNSFEKVDKYDAIDLRGTVKKRFAVEAGLLAPHKSMVCSPLSAILPLGKLALGSTGSTLAELLNAIGAKKKSEISKAFKSVIKDLKRLPGVTLSIASRMYVAHDKRLRNSFKDQAQRIFHSSVEHLDFSSRHAAQTINSWVEKETRNMVKEIVSPNDISASTSIVMVNAIYFSGQWKHTFPVVERDTFYSPSSVQSVMMMKSTRKYRYYKSSLLNAKLLEIPYKKGEASMLIVLPDARDGLTVLLHALKVAPELLNNAIERMELMKVDLTMPKFKIQTQLDLSNVYNKVGVDDVFRRGLGIKGIVKNETLFVTTAIQKAIIEVNERGTEAAGSTMINLSMSYAQPFKVNHPFLFFVMAKKQQLFAGIYVQE